MKKTMLGLSIGLSVFYIFGQAWAAPVEWKVSDGGNGHYYEFIQDSTSSWQDALTAAQTKGGYLVTISSSGENDFVRDLTLQSITEGIYKYIFLAGSDADSEGIWKWKAGPEAGANISYSNWYPGEPNNYTDEDYLTMLFFDKNTGGTWNDFDASNRYSWDQQGYVVEFAPASNPSPVPEPATMLLFGTGLAGLAAAGRRKMK